MTDEKGILQDPIMARDTHSDRARKLGPCVVCGRDLSGGPITFVDNLRPAKGAAHLACANAQRKKRP